MSVTFAIGGTGTGVETPRRDASDGARWPQLLSRVLPVVLIAIFAGVATWQANVALGGQRESTARAQRTILVAQRVAILEETAAAAQRSFALTGDTALLSAFFSSLEALPATAQRLEALAAPDPAQAARAATVSDLVAVRTRQMWESVEARRRYGPRAGRSAVQNPEIRETDRRLAEVLDAMAAAERAVLAERQAGVDRIAGSLVLAGFLTALLALVLYGAPRLIRRTGTIPAGP